MPEVPLYSKSNTPTLNPQGGGALASQRIGVNAAMFGGEVAAAEVAAGKQVENVGEQLFKRAIEVQELNNQTVARDASNKFIEEMGQADLQFRQLQGKAAIDAYPAHIENIKKIHEKYLGGLSNDSARRHFLNDSSRQLSYNVINSSHWAATQGRAYRTEVNSASVKIAQNNAAAQTDDINFANQVRTVGDAVDAQAKESNWSPEETKVQKDKQISQTWAKRLQSISMTDPVRASKLYESNKRSIMDAEQRYSIERGLQQSMYTHGANQIADSIVEGVATPASVEGREAKMMQYYTKKYGKTAAAGITANAYYESGGAYDPSAVGDNGASIGVFQHNTTRKAALEQWAKEHGRNPRELQAQMDFAEYELQNDPTLAGVADAMRAAKTPEEAAQIWHDRFERPGDRSSLRIRQARAKELTGKQYPAIGLTPNTTPGQLNEMLNTAEQRANAVLPGNEEFAETVKSKVRTQYNLVKSQANDIKNAYYQNFMGKLVDDKVTTLDQLFQGNPNNQEAYWQLTPEQHRSIQGAMEKNARGRETKWTPERAARSNELFGMASTEPEKFKRLVLANEDLPMQGPEGILALQKLQRSLTTDKEKASASTTLTQHAFAHVGDMVRPLGITATPKLGEEGTDSAKRSNMFIGAFNRDVEAFYSEKKRPPTASESREIAANLIRTQKTTVPGWLWGTNTLEERLFEVTIPEEYRKTQLELNASSPPSEEQIRNEYIAKIRQGGRWDAVAKVWRRQ